MTVMMIAASPSCSAQSLANPGFVGNEGWDIIDAFSHFKHHVVADLWLLVATNLRDFVGFYGSNDWITTSQSVKAGKPSI